MRMNFTQARPNDTAAAIWMYDRSAQTLILQFSGDTARDGEGIRLDYLERTRALPRLNNAGDYTAEQGKSERELDALFLEMPSGSAISSDSGQFIYRRIINHVSPDELGLRTSSLVAEISGRVSAFQSGSPSRCSLEELPRATVVTYLALCSVALNLDEVRFEQAGGDVLADWRRATRADVPKQAAVANVTIARNFRATATPIAPPAPAPVVVPSPREHSPAPPDSTPTQVATAPPNDSDVAGAKRGEQAPAQSDGDIIWISSPGADLVERFYPLGAYRAGRGGEVELDCLELTDGRVRDCAVVSEAPLEEGFGRAALSLSRWFRFRPFELNGNPAETRLRFTYTLAVSD